MPEYIPMFIVGVTFVDGQDKREELTKYASRCGGTGPGVLTNDPRGDIQYLFSPRDKGDETLPRALSFIEAIAVLPCVQRLSLASSDKPETHR